MAQASDKKLASGCISFLVFWILAVFPSFKLLPIGRTGGAIAGAVLTVVLQVSTPSQAYGSVDLSILGLLFGTMVISIYLERADLFKYLGNTLSWKCRGGKDLLCRICILSSVLSALLTNDSSCVILTEFVLKLCRQKGLPPKPFLLALATSANIGSSVTPIGNPQNLIVAINSGIHFGRFIWGILPSMLLGSFINIVLLLSFFWRSLTPVAEDGTMELANVASKLSNSEMLIAQHQAGDDEHNVNGSIDSRESFFEISPEYLINDNPSYPSSGAGAAETKRDQHANEPQGVHLIDCQHTDYNAGATASELQNETQRFSANLTSPRRTSVALCASSANVFGKRISWIVRKKKAWKFAVYLVTIGMLVALLCGLDMSWTVLTAAFVLMALDFRDAGPTLDQVSYALLVFFSGMFITIDGLNRTGLPGMFWDAMEPHSRINTVSGVIVLAMVIIALSNIASNVPTVLLLGYRVSASASLSGSSVVRAWLVLAWTSTVAGNLTLIGSAANMIVCEEARKVQFVGYELTFWSHLAFGLPSTLIIATSGLFLIRG